MGNPFVHIDLSTTDVSAARKFYEQVFDWKFIQMQEMGGYLGIDVGKGTGGGIGQGEEGQPPSWTSFVDVADIDETLAKAEAAGGTVLQGRMDVGGMGWLAVLLDPQGAKFGIWQSAAPPVQEEAPAPKARPKKAAPAKAKAKAKTTKKPAPAPKKKAAPAKAKKTAKKAAPAKKKR